MGEVVRLKEPPDPLTPQEDEGEYQSDNSDNMGESEIERARRLPLSPIQPRS
jgi:hypothetical protein